ncbi:hypothetical protein MKW94_017542 [Papaver nudicaule]|uniref:Bulb-type lectin domain-containing protein n=1 Tax=Papaver nudicaule TaxID=74823 RepID=A0AA42AX78_PAPNU|nr:hypothetical protein [Papaver nudicaule]
MKKSSSFSLLSSLFIFFYVFCSSLQLVVKADVPASKTFKYVNEGMDFFGMVEHNADYRPLKIQNYPFRLCFFNSTPDSYILGLGMGNANSTSLMRWVWTANHARPVHNKAKLIFSRNGNLELVDADGRVAWQTRTANKGVVDIKLLPNGNLVLIDRKGVFVWQSFDYPTDTLLVGQGFQLGSTGLTNGAYSMVLDTKEVNLFYKSPLSVKPLRYSNLVRSQDGDGELRNVSFNIAPTADGPDYADELRLEYENTHRGPIRGTQPKYNSTLSIFRLGSDGNLRIYTYYEKGRQDVWEETYTEFTSSWYAGECLLPEKCGSLGICENSQCVACPTPKGLMGWSKDCKPMKLPSCKVGAANVSYYRVDGVDHFLDTNNDGQGPMKIDECRRKCSSDCKCMAFFYRKDISMCLLTVQLNTLIKAQDSAERVSYIKYVK